MGKLKDGLNAVQTLANAIDARAGQVPEALSKVSNNGKHFMDVFDNGYDQLFLYCNEKIKSKGLKPGDSAKMTLKDLGDANVVDYVKAIEQARADAIKWVKAWTLASSKEFGGLFGDLGRLEGSLAELGKHVEKKKKKLLVSKKYKDKVAGYSRTLDDLVKAATKRKEEAKLMETEVGAPALQYLEKTKLSSADTVATIGQRATMGTTNLLKQYESGVLAQQSGARKFRDQSFAKGMATIKQWVNDADDIEKEAPEW